ncbi:transcription repressor NadR [Neobacillus notoginsengisoli]|uniref:Transcription repressor NadR n=1 Tax=Neobacillus notoginsengisoli TaxID=1578198 RepID=A0A417YTW7_9BACI|nr:transcription repressor NadR [Neobacillus notoginsengisoli]RHW40621.1 transcription repressor NadR [Neobacillus notoginsengisoli]
MGEEKKLLGEERRLQILSLLKNSESPITGSELAAFAKVSRQIIVGDITLLKAKGEPIIATSQGYLYFSHSPLSPVFEKIIACCHAPDQTEDELLLIVNEGVTVRDVKIEHPVYGDLTASIMVSNTAEVSQFMQKIKTTKAAFLSELTGGYHLHTLAAASEQALTKAEKALHEAGFLIEIG